MTSTSTLYQGLQSCLEPTLVEPRVLMNTLAPTRANFPQPMSLPKKSKIAQQEGEIEDENDNGFKDLQNQDDNVGGWSFIQALANPCPYTRKGDAEDEVYVHPLAKLHCSLNTKSLEMCTESLGSETGSDISENIEELTNFHGVQRSKCREFAKKFNRAEASFPPPLTSMSGIQIRPHREGGRLVLKAVTSTCCNSNFRAERANGRLRLSLLIHDQCRLREEDEIIQENGTSRQLGSDIGVGEYARPTRS
ncbi:hypothetical protein HAX54_039879 [Datura stramonium]|uniref:FAF domain-containing protein n=1 Tax=Datura stramonium TaxID=4076 RepID=A0ABS8VRH8_DATST|nr:hypothetical protein [Datura stramonium]